MKLMSKDLSGKTAALGSTVLHVLHLKNTEK